MIGVMEPDDAAVAAQLKAVSAALRGKLPELCQAVTDSILAQIEPLSRDQAIIDLLTVSVESNVTTLGSGRRCSPRKGADPLHHRVGIGVRRDGREHQVSCCGRVDAVPVLRAGHDAPAAGGLARGLRV